MRSHGRSSAPFGFGAILADADEPPFPPDMKITADLTIEKEIVIVGTADEVVEKVLKAQGDRGLRRLPLAPVEFEMGGYSGRGNRGADADVRR